MHWKYLKIIRWNQSFYLSYWQPVYLSLKQQEKKIIRIPSKALWAVSVSSLNKALDKGGAIKQAIAKAITVSAPDLCAPLKKAGFMKCDPREKERKKYGLRSARKREQYSKR